MSRAKLRNIWSHLPAWAALLLGGGTFISGARADIKPQPPSRLDLQAHEVIVKIDGENIFISQDGSHFEVLRLGDTPEASHLRKLLRDEVSDGQAVAIPVGSMIVASGGASGKGWGWKTAPHPTSKPSGKKENGK